MLTNKQRVAEFFIAINLQAKNKQIGYNHKYGWTLDDKDPITEIITIPNIRTWNTGYLRCNKFIHTLSYI